MKLLLTTAANLALLLLFGFIVSGHPPKNGSDDESGTQSQSAGPQLSRDGKDTRQPPQSGHPSPAKSTNSTSSQSRNSSPNKLLKDSEILHEMPKTKPNSPSVPKTSPKQPKSKSPSPKQLKQNLTPNHSKHNSPNSTPNNSKHNSPNSTPNNSKHTSPNSTPNNSKHNSPNSTPNNSKHNSPNSTPKKLINYSLTLSPAASNKDSNTNSPIGSPSKSSRAPTPPASPNTSPSRLLVRNPSANAENVVSPLKASSRHSSPERTPNSPNSSANSSPTNEAKRSPTFVSLNFNSKESQNNLLSESSSIDLPASLRTISALHFPRIERLNRPFVPALSVPTRIPTPFPSAMPSPQPLYTPTLFPPPMTDSQNSSPEEIPFGWETRNYSAENERSLYSETIHVRQVNVRDARHFILEMFTELVNFYTKFDERSIRQELLHYNVSFFTRKMSTEYGPELSSIMDEFGRRCTIKFGGDQFEGSSESVSPQQICMMGTLLTISRNISGKLRDYEQLHVEYQPTSSRSSQRTEHGSSYGDRSNLSFAAEAFADPEDIEAIEATRTMSPVDESKHLRESERLLSRKSSSSGSDRNKSCEICEENDDQNVGRISFASNALNLIKKCVDWRSLRPTGLRILSRLIGRSQNENNELRNAAREGEETSKSEGEESGEQQNQEMPMPSTTSSPMVINPAHTALFGCMQFVTPFFNSVLADWKAAVGELRQQGMITADMTLHALSELSSPEFVKLVDSQIKLFSNEQRPSMSGGPVDQN